MHRCCDSICTFDKECHFDEICKNGQCVEDENVEWQCSSGRFETPSKACIKVNKRNKGRYKYLHLIWISKKFDYLE